MHKLWIMCMSKKIEQLTINFWIQWVCKHRIVPFVKGENNDNMVSFPFYVLLEVI